MRLSYPANVKIILVPCTGKVDVVHMLKAIQQGADGVYCVGGLEGASPNKHGNQRGSGGGRPRPPPPHRGCGGRPPPPPPTQ